jgi:hypothetical protein
MPLKLPTRHDRRVARDATPTRSRSVALLAIGYAAVALAAGWIVGGLLVVGCENVDPGTDKERVCTVLNDYGGLVLLVAGPPTVVMGGAAIARRRADARPLHRAFVSALILVLVIGLGVPALVVEVWSA